MIATTHRSLTEDERTKLRKRKRRLARRLVVEPVAIPLLLVLGTVVGLASLGSDGESTVSGPALFLVGWFALGFFIVRGLWKERDALRLELARLEQTLAADRVEVVRCRATAAVTVLLEERWQIDFGWLLETGDDVLYLGGIAALPTYAGNEAPSTRFEIVWCPATGICLNTEASADEVPSHRVLDSGELAPEVLRQLPVLAKGADMNMAVLPGSVATLI